MGIPEGLSKPSAFYKEHKVDFHLGGMMFWFMGGRVSRCGSWVWHAVCWGEGSSWWWSTVERCRLCRALGITWRHTSFVTREAS